MKKRGLLIKLFRCVGVFCVRTFSFRPVINNLFLILCYRNMQGSVSQLVLVAEKPETLPAH